MRRYCGSKRKPPVPSASARCSACACTGRRATSAPPRSQRDGWRKAQTGGRCWRNQSAPDCQRGQRRGAVLPEDRLLLRNEPAQRHLEEQSAAATPPPRRSMRGRNASISSRSARQCIGVPTVGDAKAAQHSARCCVASALSTRAATRRCDRTQLCRQLRLDASGTAGRSRPGSSCTRAQRVGVIRRIGGQYETVAADRIGHGLAYR